MDKNKITTYIKIVLFSFYILIFYIFGADENKVRYSELILIIFLGLEILSILKVGKIKLSNGMIYIFLFMTYCFLSNFWAMNSEFAIDKSKTLLLLFVFVIISYNFFIDIENAGEILIKILMYSGILFSIYVIMYYGVGEYFAKLMKSERIGAEINNVNTIGLQTSISVLIGIFYALYQKDKKYLLFNIIPLIVALGTGSRKVIISLVLGTVLLFLHKREEKVNFSQGIKKISLILITLIIFIGITKLPVFSNTFERFENMLNIVTGKGKVDSSTKLREIYIELGVQQFLKTPLFGIGIGNSGYITSSETKYFTYLHNNFIELLATTGIIGFILYYSVYIYIIYYCIKFIKRKNRHINLVLIIFLINLFLEYGAVTYYSKTTYIYILLGLIIIENERKDVISEQNNKDNKTT